MVASMVSKQTYYILHVSYTNFEIVIDLPHIAPTSFDDSGFIIARFQSVILVRGAVRLLTFHKLTILAPLWFYVF